MDDRRLTKQDQNSKHKEERMWIILEEDGCTEDGTASYSYYVNMWTIMY